jgi:hypothetical protein
VGDTVVYSTLPLLLRLSPLQEVFPRRTASSCQKRFNEAIKDYLDYYAEWGCWNNSYVVLASHSSDAIQPSQSEQALVGLANEAERQGLLA